MSFFSSMTQLNRFFPFPYNKFNPFCFCTYGLNKPRKTQKIMGFEGKTAEKTQKKQSHLNATA